MLLEKAGLNVNTETLTMAFFKHSRGRVLCSEVYLPSECMYAVLSVISGQ